MKIVFVFGRADSSKKRLFKSQEIETLFRDYLKRISHFSPCEVSKTGLKDKISPAMITWLCERQRGAKAFSSEELAEKLEALISSGAKELRIVVGGADGFSDDEIRQMKPNLLWSFGPLTLPHELAAVVASEQIYRAFTILNKLPYHCGH